MSTPVGPLGSGLGGGVELTVQNLWQALSSRGHQVRVVAPSGSELPGARASELVQMAGSLQQTAQVQDGGGGTVLFDSVLANAWAYARQVQPNFDVIVNFAYDWLPFYLTPFFSTPVAHFVSMGALTDSTGPVSLTPAIARVAEAFPKRLGAYTRAQANSFNLPAEWEILGGAIALSQYEFCPNPHDYLAWVGRIAPEKGLEDAIAAALRAQHPLKIFGTIENAHYWDSLQPAMRQAPPSAPIEYCGFLPTSALQAQLGRAKALLMTPKWLEAFGLVAIEALACGVPVIAYERGALGEIIQAGRTGWLVSPGSVDGLVGSIDRIAQLDRAECRHQAQVHYSLEAWTTRFEQWFAQIISSA